MYINSLFPLSPKYNRYKKILTEQEIFLKKQKEKRIYVWSLGPLLRSRLGREFFYILFHIFIVIKIKQTALFYTKILHWQAYSVFHKLQAFNLLKYFRIYNRFSHFEYVLDFIDLLTLSGLIFFTIYVHCLKNFFSFSLCRKSLDSGKAQPKKTLPSYSPKYLWLRIAIFEKQLAKILDYLVQNNR